MNNDINQGNDYVNFDFFSNYSLVAAAAIPIILAIVQALKMTGWVKDKYAPFISIFIGIGVSMLLNNFFEDAGNTILTGILLGLSASGLYSGVVTTQKAIVQQRKEKRDDVNKTKF